MASNIEHAIKIVQDMRKPPRDSFHDLALEMLELVSQDTRLISATIAAQEMGEDEMDNFCLAHSIILKSMGTRTTYLHYLALEQVGIYFQALECAADYGIDESTIG